MSSINVDNHSREDFEDVFCKRCWTQSCQRAGLAETNWLKRISTQVDRLLENPNVANLNDPRFRDIISQKFIDKKREALRITIANQKNNWVIPTEAEIDALMQKETKFSAGPEPGDSSSELEEAVQDFLRKEVTFESETTELLEGNTEEEVEDIEEGDFGPSQVLSESKDSNVDEALLMLNHLKKIRGTKEQESKDKKLPEDGEFKSKAEEHPILEYHNTPVPNRGIMVEGPGGQPPSTKPKDPWAVPKKLDNVVEIGATIKLKGKPE